MPAHRESPWPPAPAPPPPVAPAAPPNPHPVHPEALPSGVEGPRNLFVPSEPAGRVEACPELVEGETDGPLPPGSPRAAPPVRPERAKGKSKPVLSSSKGRRTGHSPPVQPGPPNPFVLSEPKASRSLSRACRGGDERVTPPRLSLSLPTCSSRASPRGESKPVLSSSKGRRPGHFPPVHPEPLLSAVETPSPCATAAEESPWPP